jgi:2-oxoglutarate dehydrogenase E1 component
MSSEPVTGVFNDGYIAEQYELYRKDRNAVDSSWRQFFQFAETLSPASSSTSTSGTFDGALLRKVAAAASLLESIRAYGHLATPIDPLGKSRSGSPELTAEFHGLSEEDLSAIPGTVLGLPDATAAEGIARLRSLYSSTLGIESEHLGTAAERVWLREYVESGVLQEPLLPQKRIDVLRRLTQVDGLERFLERTYKGYKRFSIEGTDALVPLLDVIIEESASVGASEVAIAMAHRGRINVLAHILEKPYATIFDEFEGKHTAGSAESESGDVKYHLGAYSSRKVGDGKQIAVSLMPNPSHLEFVNPVLEGFARARQRTEQSDQDVSAVLPVLVHGDAAFPGEGIVAETFNLSRLRGFKTGGTIHVIVNNQVGFTTDPFDARSTRYSSDLAKGFEVPIVHVNADDADACVHAAQMGVAYRNKFGKDFLIDLVGYRRRGHNETDAPEFTQPALYSLIDKHPTPPKVYAARLAAEGVITAEAAASIEQEIMDGFEREREATRNAQHAADPTDALPPTAENVDGGLPAPRNEQLVAWNEQLLAWPSDFKVNPKISRVLLRRRDAMGEKGGIDWGHAEALAFASLLQHGVSIRLTGQDVERGTFSHRQAVLHDSENGNAYAALQHLPEAQGRFEVYNSPLSESAVLGFEFGYSTAAADTLVLWEAQYGDFVNVAQPIIDQFIANSKVKWRQDCSLVMLLPHGYEGGGPEHSSARLERFLQLCAQNNMCVAYPSTPAQYFHILRRQSRRGDRKPLILMQPKSLLRLSDAASKTSDLSAGNFSPVLDDPFASSEREKVKRLVFCTAKMYYDVLKHFVETKQDRPAHFALVRVDELYPWPHKQVGEIVDLYPEIEEVVWAQEEPKNMGAWSYVSPQLRVSTGNALIVRYVGRGERASPAEGYAETHKVEQERIISEIIAPVQTPAGRKRSPAAR